MAVGYLQDTSIPSSRSLYTRVRDGARAAYRVFREGDPKKPVTGEVSLSSRYALFGGKPLPFNPSLLISYKGYQILDTMRRDEQVKAALQFKKYSVLASGWHLKAPEGKPEDWEPLVHARKVLQELPYTFERAILEILSALDYGFSLSELVWAEGEDRKIWLTKIATRQPHDIAFQCDIHGNLEGVTQNNRPLPIEKLLIWSYDFEFSNYYGRSDLEAAYRAWWTKDNSYKWMGMLLERMGVPPVFALYDPNSYVGAQVGELQNVLENLQAATVGSIPRPSKDALEMWAPELAGQVGSVFIPALDRLDKDIARALLMPGLIGMTEDTKVGSLARAKVHFDVFLLVLERIRAEVQHLIQEKIVEPLTAWNFADAAEDPPQFEFLPLTEEQVNEIMTVWQGLVAQKVVTPQDSDEAHARNMLGFPEMDEDDAEGRAERNAEQSGEAMAAMLGSKPEGEAAQGEEEDDQQGEESAKEMSQRNDARPPLTAEQFARLLKEFAA